MWGVPIRESGVLQAWECERCNASHRYHELLMRILLTSPQAVGPSVARTASSGLRKAELPPAFACLSFPGAPVTIFGPPVLLICKSRLGETKAVHYKNHGCTHRGIRGKTIGPNDDCLLFCVQTP